MNKKALRKYYLQKREALGEENIELLSLKIRDLFFSSLDLHLIRNIHIFLPIRHKLEVNTWPIVETIFSSYPDKNLIISKSDPQNCTLENFLFTKDTILHSNPWGIPEPLNGKKVNASIIDLVILPLLAFDHSGNRVGYGKGFYDQFLKDCRKDVIKVGLSLFEGENEDISEIDEHDERMTYCITPGKFYKFF